MTTAADNTQADIARTIINQLAGSWGRLSAMTGAKLLVYLDNTDTRRGGVQFKFSNRLRSKPNFVRIDLARDDTYTVSFYRCGRIDAKPMGVHTGIYAEMLRELFESTTGLLVSL